MYSTVPVQQGYSQITKVFLVLLEGFDPQSSPTCPYVLSVSSPSPVLHAPKASSTSRPSSASRHGGAQLPRPPSAGRSRPPSAGRSRPPSAGCSRLPRTVSARSGGILHVYLDAKDAGIGADHGGEGEAAAQPASIGGRSVSPVLGSFKTADSTCERPDRRRPWLRPSSVSQAGSGLTAPQRAAMQTLEMLAAGSEELQQARRVKQAKIRAWLEKKDAELQERRRAEEVEVRQSNEETEQQQKKRLAREAAEQQKKICRLQAATQRNQELVMEVQRACAGGGRMTPRSRGCTCSQASMASALAAYGKARPGSARWLKTTARLSSD